MDTGPERRVPGDADEAGVGVTSDDAGAVLRLAVHGRWDWAVTRSMRRLLNKTLAEHPSAVILDLCDVDDPSGSSVPLLVMAYRAGRAMRPPVPIAVSVAPGSDVETWLRTIGAARFLPLFSTVEQARAALARDLAVPDYLQTVLRPSPDAPEQASRLVAEAGRGWAMPRLVHPAELIMSELVRNAVQHAATDVLVTVSRRGTGLHLAVRDGSTVLPPLPGRADTGGGSRPQERGLGLWLVDQLATAWGAQLSHQLTGKVVWAVLRDPPAGRRPRNRPPQALHLQVDATAAARPAPSRSARVLTPREQEVLSYLPTMLTAQDIAVRLRVSFSTIKSHQKAIYGKLGVSRRQDAVTEAVNRGLL